MIKSPLRYPGGKSKAIKKLSEFSDIAFKEYREPFVGGGSLFIYLKQCFPDRQFWINDLNTDVYSFWKAAQENLTEMLKLIKKFKKEKDGKALYRKLLAMDLDKLSLTERGARFFVLNRITFSGTTESGGYSERAFQGRFTDSSIDRVAALSEILDRNVKITNLDYSELLQNDRSGRVISSDAEHARQVSYASKRKYKLDLSSLHEDHEDDENAEIGVSLHAHPDELKVLANASKLDSLRYCQKLQQAYDTADIKVFKESVKTLNELSFTYIKSLSKSQPKLSLELLYNRVNPLVKAQLLYLLSLLLLVFRSIAFYGRKSSDKSSGFLNIITKSYDTGKLASVFFLIGFALHALAITLRIFILERAPVSNLYETFVFVAFVTALLGLILKFITKEKEISTFLGSLSAFALLLIASKFVTDGDSMKVLIAVLDSNFWLSTHVIAEMIGYAGVSLAGLIGHVYLIKYLIRQRHLSLNETIAADDPYHDFMVSVQSHHTLVSEIDLKFLNKIILGMIGFGLCFTFLGTMLGGIWADQSWGRFWGWDPKENGALLIILWTAITLHARLAGYIKDFGVAIFAIIGTMVVMLSWFGVNLLGVGLHSYGFTEGLVINLLSYFFIEFVFIFVVIFLQRRFLNKMKS
ncbi:MAG: cytochrome c biogenesis protein CcsA [Candidatus Melainabacteria bacterium]|nr:cytochrome c biogenesis protein CcsA [Candidatus Melainabacteria bacterium]